MGSVTLVSIKVYKGNDAKIISCLNRWSDDKDAVNKNGVIKLHTYLAGSKIDKMLNELLDLSNDEKLLLSVEIDAPELAHHSFYGFWKGNRILSFYETWGIVSEVTDLLNKENVEKMFQKYLKEDFLDN